MKYEKKNPWDAPPPDVKVPLEFFCGLCNGLLKKHDNSWECLGCGVFFDATTLGDRVCTTCQRQVQGAKERQPLGYTQIKGYKRCTTCPLWRFLLKDDPRDWGNF